MGSRTLYGPGNVPIGFLCGTRGGKKRTHPPCSACGGAGGGLECDSPRAGGGTCDKPLCVRCAIQVRHQNKDFCPVHLREPAPLICLCGPGTPILCAGATVAPHELCVMHLVLFDRWLGLEGGQAVYESKALSRDEKRERYRGWLRRLTPRPGMLPEGVR